VTDPVNRGNGRNVILEWLTPLVAQRPKRGHQTLKFPQQALGAPKFNSNSPIGTTAQQVTFDALYHEHFDFVWRNLCRMGVSPGEVDDAAHDVFLVVHKKLAEFDGGAGVRSWLFAIAQRVAWHYRRAQTRRRTEPLADEEAIDLSSVDNDGNQSKREALTLVHRVLSELSEERRAVFILAELEQLTMPDIAQTLHLPLNTAYSRLRLARRDFEQKLRLHCARASGRQR